MLMNSATTRVAQLSTSFLYWLKGGEDLDVNMSWEILKNSDYAFLHDEPVLGDNLILLTYGGSHAYGTNVEGSDVDIRGITFNPIDTLLANNEFEQFEDRNTDTVIYSLNKMVDLLLALNPNTCEMLGCKPEHYFYLSAEGQQLIDNRKLFLSKRAVKTFGGYANAQLRRLQNALAHDHYPQEEKEKHILGSIRHCMNDMTMRHHMIDGKPIKYSFSGNSSSLIHALREYNDVMRRMESCRDFEYGSINLYPDHSERDDMNVEIFCDVVLHHYPLRDYRGLWNELNTIVKDYDKLGKRNTKKDDLHLNKHAQHLIRLYLMCIDILEKEEIITYRENDRELLLSIRNGAYQKSDGTYRAEFFELVDDLEKKMQYAAANTSLPEQPKKKEVYEMLIEMNKNHINKKKFCY